MPDVLGFHNAVSCNTSFRKRSLFLTCVHVSVEILSVGQVQERGKESQATKIPQASHPIRAAESRTQSIKLH